MVSWAGLLFVRKTYGLSCNGLAEDNNSSLHNNGCPKLSCVVVNKYDNIDNQRQQFITYHNVVPSCPALSS